VEGHPVGGFENLAEGFEGEMGERDMKVRTGNKTADACLAKVPGAMFDRETSTLPNDTLFHVVMAVHDMKASVLMPIHGVTSKARSEMRQRVWEAQRKINELHSDLLADFNRRVHPK
jgi:hypothetical protein